MKERARGGPVFMLHAGLDLSRRRIDVCLISHDGEIVDEWASPPDADGLRGLVARAAMQGYAGGASRVHCGGEVFDVLLGQ